MVEQELFRSGERVARAGALPALAAAAILALLVVMIGLSPSYLVYDERFYMAYAYVLRGGADFATLMDTRLAVAAGPLYGYLHHAASGLTDLRPPAIRFVNVAALLVTLAAMAVTIGKLGHGDRLARATMIMAVPMMGPTAGMALTELPALAAMSLASMGLALGLDARGLARQCLWFAAAGALAGLAVLGRQTYLPALIAFPLLAVFGRRLVPGLIGLAAALLACAPMILAWGGLAPPWLESHLGGIAPKHGVLAFVYLATAFLLIAPRFYTEAFASRRMQLAGAATVLLLLAIAAAWGVRFDVAYRAIAVFPLPLQPRVQLGVTTAMMAVAALWLVAGAHHAWRLREDRAFLPLFAMTGLLNGTAVGVAHQFSSRYVLAAFPFALLMLQRWITPGPWAAGRILLGGLLGAVSLAAYFWNHGPLNRPEEFLGPPGLYEQMPILPDENDAGARN